MEPIAIDEVEAEPLGNDGERRRLTEPLGTTDVAINRYRLGPGDRLAGLHAHEDQEEVSVVLDGRVAFETLDGAVDVEAGEAIRFAPGEFQSGTNASDGDAALLALGAPRDSDAVRIPVPCPACGRDDVALSFGDEGGPLVCPDCGTEPDIPTTCPACGRGELRVVPGVADGETPVTACPDCETEIDVRE